MLPTPPPPKRPVPGGWRWSTLARKAGAAAGGLLYQAQAGVEGKQGGLLLTAVARSREQRLPARSWKRGRRIGNYEERFSAGRYATEQRIILNNARSTAAGRPRALNANR